MPIFRRGATGLAAAVLLAQLCVFAVAAVAPAFCCPRAAATDARPDCCKGKGHACPLLKKTAAPDHGDSLRACPRTDERIATLLFGTTGVLVAVEPLAVPELVAVVEHEQRSEADWLAAAETPPPRA